jgi:hypothetical protein
MNKNRLVLTVYSRTYKAANDDALSKAAHSTQRLAQHNEVPASGGWDPFEVWRTRIHPILKRPLER